MSYSDKFQEAVALALELHHTQTRKGGDIPYVTHLFAVASLVGEHGGTEEEVIAALLHDGPEDQGGLETLERIRVQFGPVVADIVEGCSDTFDEPKPAWEPRKSAYIENMETASRSVHLVSCADKLHNARCLLTDLRVDGPGVWDRFSGSREQTLWYYRTLIEVYDRHFDSPLVRALAEVVHDIEAEADWRQLVERQEARKG